MGLNNIQLPSIVLQKLFKHSLIDLKNEQPTALKTASKTFQTLGNNRRHVIIIIESTDTMYLPDEQLNFLLGILAACNLTMDDVAILNISKNDEAEYKAITQQLHAEIFFLFGVLPSRIALPLDFPPYQIQQYNNQVYLAAPLLSHFQDNKAEKVKLWNCLKQIFSI